MPEDKVIKTGQITLPRILFLCACGGVLVVTVAYGYLIYGYLLLTLVLCVLLGVIAFDYGVNMDKVEFDASPVEGAAFASAASAEASPASTQNARLKKRSNRPVKKRR
ncbi:MAG TPA: hypothetical protein VJX67_19730 [Blastocatellia bacterium]|nr:hypothetical protein [Blastocatellia bacterium]